MLRIEQLQIGAAVDKNDNDIILDELSRKFDLLIYNSKKSFVEKLNLDVEDRAGFVKDYLYPGDLPLLGGDLVYIEPETLIYYQIEKTRENVELGINIEVGVIGDIESPQFKVFRDTVKEAISDALVDPEADWEPVKSVDRSFNIALDSSFTVTPASDDITAASELSNPRIHHLLEIMLEKDANFFDKLKEKANIENLSEIVRKLEDLNVLTSDFAVLCSKTSQQILKVPDKDALADVSKKGLKCFICGASITDEKVVRSVSITDFGKKILENDYWLLVMMLDSLKKFGLEYEQMHVITDDSPGTRIFLNINNEAVMIQLINEELSLDDAYLINAHISAYKIDYLIVVSTRKLSLLMKNHLVDSNLQSKVCFIESLKNLNKNIQSILLEKEKNRIESILKNTSSLTSFSVQNLVLQKILPGGLHKPLTGLEDPLFSRTEEVAPELSAKVEPEEKKQYDQKKLNRLAGEIESFDYGSSLEEDSSKPPPTEVLISED